jgi:hypothetical protein
MRFIEGAKWQICPTPARSYPRPSKAILLRKGSFSVSDKGHSDAERCIGIELCKLCNQSVAQLIVGIETQKPVILVPSLVSSVA